MFSESTQGGHQWYFEDFISCLEKNERARTFNVDWGIDRHVIRPTSSPRSRRFLQSVTAGVFPLSDLTQKLSEGTILFSTNRTVSIKLEYHPKHCTRTQRNFSQPSGKY